MHDSIRTSASEAVFFGPFKGLVLLRGGIFLYIFSGFAIDRSKKYIKVIKNHKKIDAVNPQAAADNAPPIPGHNGKVPIPLQPLKPRQIVRCLRMLTHARSYFNPLMPFKGLILLGGGIFIYFFRFCD